jgi:hypothetical protein
MILRSATKDENVSGPRFRRGDAQPAQHLDRAHKRILNLLRRDRARQIRNGGETAEWTDVSE